jgi:hypothetical protein
MFTRPRSSIELARLIADRGAGSVLIVTDPLLLKLGVVGPVMRALEEAGLQVHVFSDVEPDPTVDMVMAGVGRRRAASGVGRRCRAGRRRRFPHRRCEGDDRLPRERVPPGRA